MAARAGEPKTIRVEDLVPVPPELAAAAVDHRATYWRLVGERALAVKKAEVLEGIGADGEDLQPVRRTKGGPPLIPHNTRSRTYRLLAMSHRAYGATLYWRPGEGRTTWPTILGYHAYRHDPYRSLPVRNTIGISPEGTREVMAESETWQAGFKAGRDAALKEVLRGSKVAPKDLRPKVREVVVKETKVERGGPRAGRGRGPQEGRGGGPQEGRGRGRAAGGGPARIRAVRALADARERAEAEARAREAEAEERRRRRPYHAASEAIRAAHEKQRGEVAGKAGAAGAPGGVHHRYPDLIPAGPIAERIRDYHVGEAKRLEVLERARDHDRKILAAETRRDEAAERFHAKYAEQVHVEGRLFGDPPPAPAEARRLEARLDRLVGETTALLAARDAHGGRSGRSRTRNAGPWSRSCGPPTRSP